VLIKLE